jgi:hypothetical protein
VLGATPPSFLKSEIAWGVGAFKKKSDDPRSTHTYPLEDMSSIVYLGTTPKASQAVSSDLRARGINLLKAAPCDIKALVLTSAPPTYSIYKSNLAAYIRAAETGTHVLLSEPYLQFSNQSVPVFIPCTSIIFSFDTVPLPETRDKIKAEFSAEDTMTRGKPALKAEMYLGNVRALVANYDPVQTTPGTSSSINLSAYKQFRLLHRLFDTFCRTQQYTFYDKQFNERAIELDSSSMVKVDHMATGGDGTYETATNPCSALTVS